MPETVRVSAESSAQVATTINGVEYRARKGYFDLPPDAAKAHRAFGNLPTPSAIGPVGRSGGYRCEACGFGSFFVTCSRCQGECTREG